MAVRNNRETHTHTHTLNHLQFPRRQAYWEKLAITIDNKVVLSGYTYVCICEMQNRFVLCAQSHWHWEIYENRSLKNVFLYHQMITLSLNVEREFSRENRMSHNYKSGMLLMDFLLIFQLHLSYFKKIWDIPTAPF